MTLAEALAFVEHHGVVLASAKGPVPRMSEAIAGEPIRGSWWAHPKSRAIFSVLDRLSDSPDILVCRLVDGKVTFVHCRLWPALVRIADRFSRDRLAQVHEEHTPSGRHRTTEVPFPDWVPDAAHALGATLTEDEALRALGAWTSVPASKARSRGRSR